MTLAQSEQSTVPAQIKTEGDAQVSSFADLGLPESIVSALAKNGVTTPFPIQQATIPDALSGKDVLGRGRTGSGKTLSFGLPLLVRLAADGDSMLPNRPRGMILVPTRELAMQVADALDPYARALKLEMKVVCGGTSMPRQIDALKRGVDAVVATPGRLRDLMERKVCKLDRITTAVLDEADQMADMGFLPEVTQILDQIPVGGQRMLFSATLEKEIDTLVKRYLNAPVTHSVDPSAGAVTTMRHHVFVVKPNTKAPVTSAIAGRKGGRTLVFVRTQMGVDRVAQQLREAGVRADALHGGMTQQVRTAVLESFKAGKIDTLVATDVAARGIHVDGIDLVLHADPARDGKDYLHRAGRTARAGRSGTVVTLALPHQRKTVFGMLERVDVTVDRHLVNGIFDDELAEIIGARSLTEMEANTVAREAEMSQSEADALTKKAEHLTARAAALNGQAARLRDRAAKERSGEIPMEKPQGSFSDEPPRNRSNGRRKSGSWQKPGRRHDRGGRFANEDGGRGDRGKRGYSRHDDRRPNRRSDSDKRGSFQSKRRDHGISGRRKQRGGYQGS